MSEHDDKTLIQQCLNGVQQAYGELINRHQKAVFNVALRMAKDCQDAQDITQTVFIKAYENLATFDARHKFFSWIYRMTVNEALNFVKRSRRFEGLSEEREVATQEQSPEESYEENEMSLTVQNALMLLTPEYRALIILKHFERLSYEELGYIFDIPAKTVKSRLFTARQILKDILLKQGFARTS